MTRTCGYEIVACPYCCAKYRRLRYSSINFMAAEQWTDGYAVGCLMPPSEFMRLCTLCNSLYNVVDLEEGDDSEVDYPYLDVQHVPEHMTPHVLKALLESPADSDYRELFEAELRIRLWQSGNDWYRKAYLEAREENVEVPPPWSLSAEQQGHLERLSEICESDSRYFTDRLMIVEIFRQLRRFDRAEQALERVRGAEHWCDFQRLLIERKMSHVGLYP